MSLRSLLWNQIIDALKSGKAKAYSAADFTYPLTPSEVNKIIVGSVDTLYIENIDPPYDMIMKTIERKPEVVQWRFFEDVIYNSKKNTLTKKVNYLVPVIANIDQVTGELRGWQPLMAVKMN